MSKQALRLLRAIGECRKPNAIITDFDVKAVLDPDRSTNNIGFSWGAARADSRCRRNTVSISHPGRLYAERALNAIDTELRRSRSNAERPTVLATY